MTHLTQEMIDAVFANGVLRRRFTNPRKDKAICEMRMSGAIYTDVGKRYRRSQYYCIQCVKKVERLYRVFIEA